MILIYFFDTTNTSCQVKYCQSLYSLKILQILLLRRSEVLQNCAELCLCELCNIQTIYDTVAPRMHVNSPEDRQPVFRILGSTYIAAERKLNLPESSSIPEKSQRFSSMCSEVIFFLARILFVLYTVEHRVHYAMYDIVVGSSK